MEEHMRKKTARIVAVVVGVGILVVGTAFTGRALAHQAPVSGQQSEEHGGRGQGRGMRGLALTEDQQQQADELRMKQLKETMPIETDVQIKRMELDALWRAEDLDGKKIVAKVKEISSLQARLQLARTNQRLGFYKLLTPEQRKQARGMRGMMGRQRGMRGIRGKMGGHGRMRGMGQGRGGECGGDHEHGSGPGHGRMRPPQPPAPTEE
jgi:Spy/CpxP family protein refolding chaperone